MAKSTIESMSEELPAASFRLVCDATSRRLLWRGVLEEWWYRLWSMRMGQESEAVLRRAGALRGTIMKGWQRVWLAYVGAWKTGNDEMEVCPQYKCLSGQIEQHMLWLSTLNLPLRGVELVRSAPRLVQIRWLRETAVWLPRAVVNWPARGAPIRQLSRGSVGSSQAGCHRGRTVPPSLLHRRRHRDNGCSRLLAGLPHVLVW